jgi:hypothetical protein
MRGVICEFDKGLCSAYLNALWDSANGSFITFANANSHSGFRKISAQLRNIIEDWTRTRIRVEMCSRRHRLPPRVAQCFDKARDSILLASSHATCSASDSWLRVMDKHQDSLNQLLDLRQITCSLDLVKLKPLDQIIPVNSPTALRRNSAISYQPRNPFNAAIYIGFTCGKRNLSLSQTHLSRRFHVRKCGAESDKRRGGAKLKHWIGISWNVHIAHIGHTLGRGNGICPVRHWGAKGKGKRGGARVITFYGGPTVPCC